MVKCKLTPYEGNEPYIFISYAHKDSEAVFPILDELENRGFRVWYDAGIAPGSEWPEYIAEHLNSSDVVMAFISPNSIASPNCRREVTFALSKKKQFIGVILEPTEMSLGMEMQLSAHQCVMKYNFSTDEAFYKKLATTPDLQRCKVEKKEEPVAVQQPVAPATVPEKTAPMQNAISAEDMKAVEQMHVAVSKPAEEPAKVVAKEPAKAPVDKQAKKPLDKKMIRNIAIGAAGALLVLILGIAIAGSAGGVKLADGKKISSSDSSVYVRNLSITQDQLKKIGKLKKLTSINFYDCDIQGDLSVLNNAANIRTLCLENSPMDSYAFLEDMDNLMRLNLDGGNLTDAEAQALQDMKDLTELSLVDNANFTKTELIPTAKLTSLILDGTGITSIEDFKNCDSLRTLSVSRTKVTSIPAEFMALRLERVEMQGLESLSDLSAFENLTQLKTLKIAGTKVSDITWISQSRANLITLDISGAPISDASKEAISGCIRLAELYMNAVPSENLDFVAELTELQTLFAANCGLKDVSGIANLTQLKKVWLNNNELTDFASVSGNLEELNLAHNQISDLSKTQGGKYLAIYDNPVDFGTIPSKDSMSYLMVSYDDAMSNKDRMATYGKFYVTDIPANKLVELQDLYPYKLIETTSEQLDQWIWDALSLNYFNWATE